MKKIIPLIAVLMLFGILGAEGQEAQISAVQGWLKENTTAEFKDFSELKVTGWYTSEQTEISHLYLSQSIGGKRVVNSGITAAFKEGELAYVSHNILQNIQDMASGSEAISYSAAYHSMLDPIVPGLQIIDLLGTDPIGRKLIQLNGLDYSHRSKLELVYVSTPENGLRLAWSFDADMPNQKNWYNYYVDAENGSLLHKEDWVLTCSFDHDHNVDDCEHSHNGILNSELEIQAQTIFDGSSYNVLEFPVESPIHGERTIVTEPADPVASPFGWHDTNGEEGAEFTITRGNNVWAYEDVNDANSGNSAFGGEDLTFDFPYNPNLLPENYQDAAITNLFYANNRIHDIMHYYGFDEASGNFQATNYSNQGQDNDFVRAEAQDGGGLNNANFATPTDGQSGRMQMYLWNTGGNANDIFVVNSPAGIAGTYASSSYSAFGPNAPAEGITGDLVVMTDGEDNEGCVDATNPADVDGKIAVVYRGGCNFTDKVINAQAAGALACIVINNQGGFIDMGGFAAGIEIPSIMVAPGTGTNIVEALESGETVNATLSGSDGSNFNDGSFDNGIIIHEYGHGISIRLTGGPNINSGLFNSEQMGEGWSDYYAIAFTMDMDVDDPVFRPMAVFANGDGLGGNGIRPAPYDTTWFVNSFTYGDVANENSISQPHGIGFIWCSMLWDMTWLLIEEHGYDEDIINGTGGNNIAIRLVTEALKLQPTSPGFVDGRDAILAADELLYDGAHECLIWEAFARRGLGWSADQGSSESRSDGQEAFDIPPLCQTVTSAPTALFSSNTQFTCTGSVQFFDESIDVAQSWLWDFGDGNTSEEPNPLHIYEEPGLYTVSLTVSNTLGEDTQVQENYIEFGTPESPVAEDVEACSGDIVTLSATTSGQGFIEWRDEEGNILGSGDDFEIEAGAENETFFAYTVENTFDPVFVGPEDESFSGGGNHATDFTGTVDFEAFSELVILSAYVVSGAEGPRTVSLWDGYGGPEGNGSIIQTITVEVPFTGPGTVQLGFDVPAPGQYSIGLNQANLFRNNEGAFYPYTVDDLMSIVGSSAGPDFYYYFYNLEVDKPNCESAPTEVELTINGSAQFDAEVNDLTVNFTDISGSTGPWSWDFGDGNGSDEQNPIHTYASSGTYTVTLNTESGCSNSSDINVGTVGVEDIENTDIVVLPNPADDIIRIIDNDRRYKIEGLQIYDLSGRLIINEIIQNKETLVDVSQLSSGTYILTLGDRDGNPMVREQLIIAH